MLRPHARRPPSIWGAPALAAAAADYGVHARQRAAGDVVRLFVRTATVVAVAAAAVLAGDYRSTICVSPSVSIGPATFCVSEYTKYSHTHTRVLAHETRTHETHSLAHTTPINYKYGPRAEQHQQQTPLRSQSNRVKWVKWGWWRFSQMRIRACLSNCHQHTQIHTDGWG